MPMPAKKKTRTTPKEPASNTAKVKPAGKLQLKLHRVTGPREFLVAMGLNPLTALMR